MSILAQYRQRAGINQKRFAELAGVDNSVLSRVERGQALPSLALAARIEKLTRGEVPAISWVEGESALPVSYASVVAFLERHVLATMVNQATSTFGPTEIAFRFKAFENEWLGRDLVRAICRGLVDKGFAEYRCGLFNEDGETAGAGYGITPAGLAHFKALEGDDDQPEGIAS